MRIDYIQLKNYRCFDSLSLSFHPRLTVLIAPNGQGKTSVLDAVKVALWPFVAGFDLGSTTNDVTGIHIDDVRRVTVTKHERDWRLPADVEAKGFIQVRQLINDGALKNPFPGPAGIFELLEEINPDVPWQSERFRDSIKKATKTKDVVQSETLDLNATATALERRIFSDRKGAPDDLPMLGYYGTGRLWAQKKLTAFHERADAESQSRTFAYRDCLDSASSYKHFVVWFSRVHQSYLQEQIRNLERRLPLDTDIPSALIGPLRAVQGAVDAILHPHTGWHRLEYSMEHDELILNHEEHGQMKVSQLSDGIRNMLALVGDISYRCYKLNAHMGEDAPRRTAGIVLIDEVDMHLHPGWQQTVLIDLMEAFPRLQFVVTTHSPQVLTSVDASCIRMLRDTLSSEGERNTVIEPVKLQTKGVASSDLLAQIMGVDPIPNVPEARMLAKYHALIQEDLYESAEGASLREELVRHFGKNHPVMRECERMIRLQEFKRRLPLPAQRSD